MIKNVQNFSIMIIDPLTIDISHCVLLTCIHPFIKRATMHIIPGTLHDTGIKSGGVYRIVGRQSLRSNPRGSDIYIYCILDKV